jgi:hypothetical protein
MRRKSAKIEWNGVNKITPVKWMQLCNIVKSGWELKKCNKQDEINK